MAYLGGIGTIYGAALGAFALQVLPEFVHHFKDYERLGTGVVLMLVLAFFPSGLYGSSSASEACCPFEVQGWARRGSMTARSASSASPRTLLQVSDLSKSFGGYSPSKAWASTSYRPHQGDHRTERRGKSTLLNLIGGSLRPDRGAVVMDGIRLIDCPRMTLPDTRGSDLPTGSPLQQQRDNRARQRPARCASAFRALDRLDTHRGNGGKEERFRAEAREWLDFFGLGQMEAQQPRSLAFGQQRYVELARAMMLEPKLLLRTSPRRD